MKGSKVATYFGMGFLFLLGYGSEEASMLFINYLLSPALHIDSMENKKRLRYNF